MSKAGKSKKYKAPRFYINRELSWLEFNHRVLSEGLSPTVPLMERLKFLAIVSSNLDEFFMIRVAGLMQQRHAGLRRHDPSGLTPVQQLAAISRRVHRMVDEQSAGIRQALDELRHHGLNVIAADRLTPQQRDFLREHFLHEVAPILTPLAVEDLQPTPLLPGLTLHVALLVARRSRGASEPRLIVVPVPTQLPRFIDLPSEKGITTVQIENVIANWGGLLVPNCDIISTAFFRITRDADVPIEDDEAEDLLSAVEMAVISRRQRAAVRLAISTGANPHIVDWLSQSLDLSKQDV